MVPRAQLAVRLAELVGSDALVITDPLAGWPARGQLRVDDGLPVPVDLFVGPVRSAHRPDRRGVERRFQNPGQGRAVQPSQGRVPLLVGVWEADDDVRVERPVVALADPRLRAERTRTRFSVFQHLPSLVEAMHTGWVEHVNSRGERLRYVLPPLLPMAVGADISGAAIPDTLVRAMVLGSGLADSDQDALAAVERARRATTVLVRNARFAKRVVDAYDGMCSMCGLDAGLVEGAHIYPAAAAGSHDEPWNGLALCPTHHSAFDRHLVAVRPHDHRIVYRDTLTGQAASNPGAAALVAATFRYLALPSEPASWPSPEMFRRRHDHFGREYDWLTA